MNKIIKYSLLPLLASLSLTAAAADGKIYPATQCQSYDYASNLAFVHEYMHTYNGTGSTRRLVCPILKDAAYRSGTLKNGLYDIKIWAVDNNNAPGDPRVKCGIYSNYLSGSAVEISWGMSKPGADENIQMFTIPAVDTATYGSVSLYCFIPGGDSNRLSNKRPSSLIGYSVTEKN